MFYDYLINIIVVLFLCCVVILMDLSLNKKYSNYRLGVMFGLITIFAMSSKVIVEGRFFDFRHIIITMAGFIGGPVTALIAAIISSLYRYDMGGVGTVAGIINNITFACFGSILGRHLRDKQNGKKLLVWFLIGMVMAFIRLSVIIVSSLWMSDSVTVLRAVSVPFLIITPLATTIIVNFYYWTYEFMSKVSILNTIMNSSQINLMIFDTNGPILCSNNLKTERQFCPYIENPFPLLDNDKTWLKTTKQQHREIAAEDGRHFEADLSSFQMPSGVNACVTIINDVTDRKVKQEQLRLANERFSKAFQLGPHMMAIIRKSDYRYVDVNCRFLEVRGFAREEVIGKTPIELGMSESEFKGIIMALEEQGSVQNLEYPLVTKYGVIATVILSAERIHIDDQECILFAYNDVTEMKRMQTERIEQLTKNLKLEADLSLRDEMSRLDRLNLVGQLAAGIAHEIRNPMTTVRGYLQLLGVKPEYEAKKSTFDLMISEVDRANAIITEFLSLAQTKPTELKSQSLNDILNNLYPLLEADAFTQNKQIHFMPWEIPDLELNTNEISQLILNLTHNGLEAMEERGCLTVKSYLQDGNVVLAIADEGCGIPPENINKIGTPFFTTKDNGTGLGLATCYRIAESHKAKIRIDSCPKGTTFFVLFPTPDKEQEEKERIA